MNITVWLYNNIGMLSLLADEGFKMKHQHKVNILAIWRDQ